jgi:small ligand-binding sensory domain FIST
LEANFANFAAILREGELPIVIADHHTFDTTRFLALFNRYFPSRPMSGGTVIARPGSSTFHLNGVSSDEGALVVIVPRKNFIATALGRGAKAIGTPLTVTKVDGTRVQGLSSQSALRQLEQLMLDHVDPAGLVAIAEGGLRLGVVTNEYADIYGPDDFELTSIVDVDTDSGAIIVQRSIPLGSVVQFHITSRQCASDSLSLALSEANPNRVEVDMTLIFAGLGAESDRSGSKSSEPEIVADTVGESATLGASVSTVFGNVGGVTREIPRCSSVVLLKG